MADSIPLVIDSEESKKKEGPAFLMMLLRGICNVQYKSLLFLFIIFIFVTSDVFNSLLLSKIDGAILEGSVAPYGVVIQGALLVICYTIIQFLIEQKII